MATDDAPNLRRLARQLVDVTRRLKHLETVPQLAHSSLDDHGMPVYDADGNLTVTIGKQADGTWGAPPVKGPVPPQPAGVEAEGDAGVIRASWQGVFWAGAAKPMDFEAVEVLVDGTVYAGIHDPQGGSVSVPALSGVRAVSFRTLSQAGVVSASMGHVQVTVEPRVSEQMQELHENLDELNDVTLPELRDDLADSAEDLQGKLDNLNARVDDLVVDGGGSGNFTTYSDQRTVRCGHGRGRPVVPCRERRSARTVAVGRFRMAGSHAHGRDHRRYRPVEARIERQPVRDRGEQDVHGSVRGQQDHVAGDRGRVDHDREDCGRRHRR